MSFLLVMLDNSSLLPLKMQLHWNRADVVGRIFFAHDDMVVRSALFNSHGAPILQHMVDNVWE